MAHHPTQTDPPVFSKALLPYGATIFSEMTALANRWQAVNLSQGFPDWDGPEEIRARAAEAIMRGPNQYAPTAGIPELRQAIARKMERFYHVAVDPEREVTVTAGATEGLCATLLGVLNPGDEVVFLEPCYDSYPPVAAIAGATMRFVSLEGADFRLPREKLAAAFGPRTRAIVVNNPQNPCGKVYSRDELAFIGSLCIRYRAFAVADEVYEHLTYDGREHLTMLAVPELRDRAIVISSTAKTFSLTGWKIGYVVAAPELTQAVRMSHQFITFCSQPPLQEAMAFAIDLPDQYYTGLCAAYTRRREMFCNALLDLGLTAYPPEGAYYVLVDISSLGYEDDLEFCRMLPAKVGVAAIPCSYFWKDRRQGRRMVRFCFCKRDETLREGISRLRRWLR